MVARGGSGLCNLWNENAARGDCWKLGRTSSSILDIGGSGARRCGGGRTLATGAGALFSRCCCGELIDIWSKPKSKEPNLSIAECVGIGLSSGLATAVSRAVPGVEFPRARDGVGGASVMTADNVGRCLVCGFRKFGVVSTSPFFLSSITFLKSLRENRSDILGLTQRDFDCASA